MAALRMLSWAGVLLGFAFRAGTAIAQIPANVPYMAVPPPVYGYGYTGACEAAYRPSRGFQALTDQYGSTPYGWRSGAPTYGARGYSHTWGRPGGYNGGRGGYVFDGFGYAQPWRYTYRYLNADGYHSGQFRSNRYGYAYQFNTKPRSNTQGYWGSGSGQ